MESVKNIEHYLRLNLLNIKGATPALHAVVLKIASLTYEQNVDDILKYFKSELERLVDNSTIAKKSFDSLFPIDGSKTDVTKWDVTLASTVLLNCCTVERKRKDLTRVLLHELKLNGSENDVPAYLKAKASELNAKKGELITEKQHKELQDAEKVTDLRVDLIICLLLVCGSLISRDEAYDICKSILLEEIEIDFNNKTAVQSYLNTKKGIIEILKKDLKLFDNEFKQLYGDKISNDINLLNKNLLVLFVLNTCERLKPASQVEIKKIRKLRSKMIAHKGKAELKFGEFLSVWTDLYNAITTLLKEEDIDLDFEKKVKHIKKGDLDIDYAIDELKKHYQEESNDYQILKRTVGDLEERFTEKIEAYQTTMQELLKNSNSKVQELTSVMASRVRKGTIADFRKEMEISCLDIKIVVKGNDTKAVENAHQAIEKAMKDPTGVEREKRKAMNKILDIIERDGSTVIEVKKGSVIATIRCRHLEGVSKLLIYVDSEEWMNDFKEVTTDLGQELGQQFAVETNIQEESMQMLYNDIKQKDSEYEEILPLSFGHEQTHDDENANEMENDFESNSNAYLERITYLEDRITTKVTQVEQMRDQLGTLNIENEKLKVTLKVHEDKDKFDQETRRRNMKDVIKCFREENDEINEQFKKTKKRYADEEMHLQDEMKAKDSTIEELNHTISIQAINAEKQDEYIKQTMREMEEIRNTIKARERELHDQNIKCNELERSLYEARDKITPGYQEAPAHSQESPRLSINWRPMQLADVDIVKLETSNVAQSHESPRLPINWRPMQLADVDMVKLETSDVAQKQEYIEVEKHFKKTMDHAEITVIRRVQNPLLWAHYVFKKREMKSMYGQGCANELHLYHGTRPDLVDIIAHGNFNFRFPGSRVGNSYGDCSYFTTTAKYSDQNASTDDRTGLKTMFLVKVLVGKTCLGEPGLNSPQQVDPDDFKKKLYNTVVNNVLDPTVYCVFDMHQCYPKYIIEYSHILDK